MYATSNIFMVLKKVLPLLVATVFLVGCSTKKTNSIMLGKKSESKEEISYGENLLNELQNVYETQDFPYTILLEVVYELEKNKNVKDENMKQELITLMNDAVLKMLDTEDPEKKDELEKIFYPDGKVNINNIAYEDYLTDIVKQKVINVLNPTYATLKSQNLTMEILDNYNNVIRKGSLYYGEDGIFHYLNQNKIKYRFIGEDFESSSFLVLTEENIVIEFD
ncbi:hypothetical protein V6C31_03460 [Caldibacillus debilis]